MEAELDLRVVAAVLKFLEQQELAKTAKALRKEASKREWDLEAAAAEGQQFDLLQLCSAAARASEEAEEAVEKASKKSKKKKINDEESTKSNKKARAIAEKENPEAEATQEAPETDSSCSKQNGKTSSEKKAKSEEESAAKEEPQDSQKGSKGAAGFKRFQRIDDTRWTAALPAELKDNSFWKKKNDSFAAKAAEQLGRVRGKDFRHEKTKKKRATWKGCGELPMTVNSIQFASDSE
ncbi:nucleolar phosphoprotein p130, putative [Eimeria necatrix]|uniref:Nucleolar phosphoprotein p130, putative n=1 Tax=Eimeria necatrix TaxID=51315 RepID=U6MIM5_9EIME|nr:nucleolar phosphoprotein p130, putative [Eimeria necatrix]CDJ62314.1 nucleolar phosphoprotein p130, putative [Eimeria necatrix]